MSTEPTTQNIIEAIQDMASHTDKRLQDAVTSLTAHTDKRHQVAMEAIGNLASNTDKRLRDATEAINSLASHTDERHQDILEAVQGLATHVDRRFDEAHKDLQFEIHEIRSEMVTKAEHKADLAQFKNEIVTEIDRFVTLHQTLDIELVAVRHRCDRMESFMDKVAKRLDLEYNHV